MDILLLSPYDAISHQYWRKGLIELLPEHRFTVVTLKARYFSWRFRGNSLTMAHDKLLQDSYDLVIATSMTDLSALKGMCSSISQVPSILYFHENQFAYPESGPADHRVERQITSLYAALAADQLVFNSAFNHDSFLQGVSALLKKLPDGIPPDLNETLKARSCVNSVALRPRDTTPKPRNAELQIVWNHRWEYDKGIEVLEEYVTLLLNTGLVFTMHVIGQSFRKIPREIKSTLAKLELHGRLGVSGFIEDKQDYFRLLDDCDLVLSTAHHEFQGLAVLEAIQSGCVPIVPDALAYQEFIPSEYRYTDLEQAIALTQSLAQQVQTGELPSPVLPEQVSWPLVQAKWRCILEGFT